MRVDEINTPVQPDTYEASMLIKQAIRAGKYAIQIHNLLSNEQEVEAWVAKKLDLASAYVSSVAHYLETQPVYEYDDNKQQIKYKPTINVDQEWDEAGYIDPRTKQPRYPQLAKLGPAGFAALVNKGRNVKVTRPENIKNTTATTVQQAQQEFNNLEVDKKQRFQQAIQQGEIERPIVVRFGPGDTNDVLIAGNTRYTGLMSMGIKPEVKFIDLSNQKESAVQEDAGEGHMAKSQMYKTAKYAVQITTMVKPGDDIEAWVQTKMNRAVDMLDAVYHYEDYQRMNPYREDLGDEHAKHGLIIQKKIDEILEFELPVDDIETKPVMFNILNKRVTEFEKEMTKKVQKDKTQSESLEIKESPRAVGRALANLKYAKAMANGIMKGEDMVLLRPKAQAFLGSADETIELLDKMYSPVKEEQLDEGIRDWAKKLAMAGVVVAGLAGIGSINDAINNSVPAIKAMNTAYEMATDAGNTDLANMIKQDIKDAKLRLDTGKDLSHVKYLQDKYSKFMVNEYNQTPFKRKVMSKLKGPVDVMKQKRDQEAYRDKMQTLQNISKNKYTQYDQELKDKLAARLDKLRTTGL